MLIHLCGAVGALLGGPHADLTHISKRTAVRMVISDGERAAVERVTAAASRLTRFGLDSGDRTEWDRLAAAVNALDAEMPPDPPIATDKRLVGDWELIGCTSYALVSKKGLTGLGVAPFTNLGALHCSFTAAGRVTAKETLEFFGKPVIMNELRGTVSFSADGDSMEVARNPASHLICRPLFRRPAAVCCCPEMRRHNRRITVRLPSQESYAEGDLGGQQNSPAFRGMTFTLLEAAISSCGTLRIGRDDDIGVYVWRKLAPGELAQYLEKTLLPAVGGTYLGNPSWKGPVERA
jgi:hypothetical protein